MCISLDSGRKLAVGAHGNSTQKELTRVLEISVPSPRSRWQRGEFRIVCVPTGNRRKAQNVEMSSRP
ncbi:unnamed protein product [Pleuronectes platessa]|uniref:Uncharacterized protein n=1 Tax=Pleuronectes platessa TaxID=8262 RepID=A0A9N7UYA7_PLEPL|nr:unnamed protein product [Pleuronectes platessa]